MTVLKILCMSVQSWNVFVRSTFLKILHLNLNNFLFDVPADFIELLKSLKVLKATADEPTLLFIPSELFDLSHHQSGLARLQSFTIQDC